MSFFDDDPETPPAAGSGPASGRQANMQGVAGSSRAGSVGASSSTSFLDRLRSTSASPAPAPAPPAAQRQRQRQQQRHARRERGESENESYRSDSISAYGAGSHGLDDPDLDLDLDLDQHSLASLGASAGTDAELDLDLDVDDEELDDVRRLMRAWVQERGTPDIAQWQGELMDTILDKLEQQQKMVTTLRSDPQTSEEEHFKLILVQTEMERVKYLVRSYVRTRLHKIEKYAHYITLTPNIHHLLSGAELSHAQRYTDLLHTHFQHSVLDSLPEWLRKMDDTYGDGLSMVTKPNRNVPVLIYCRKECGEITLEGGERAALAKGTTHLVKYRLVERWINLGWAEVL